MDQKMVERLFRDQYVYVSLVKAYGPRKALVHLQNFSGMRTNDGSCATCGAYRMGTCVGGCSDNIYYSDMCEVTVSKAGNFRFRWL